MGKGIKLVVLPIIMLFLLGGALTAVPARASSEAVLVYDYGFATAVRWVAGGHAALNKTSVFTQNERLVIGYVSAALYAANLTAQWYDPTGQLYLNQTSAEECVASPCTFLFYLPVANTPASARLGLWRMDLLADGFKLYSAYFTITPVIIEDDYWSFNIAQSVPTRIHGELTVTVNPTGQNWSSYSRYIPYAANVTAHEAITNRALNVTTNSTSYATLVLVELDGAPSKNYTFVLNFDLNYSLVWSLSGGYGGRFAFSWQDQPWERIAWARSLHPTDEAFNITLPKDATLVDLNGVNTMALDYNVSGGERTSVYFNGTAPPEQPFGWTMIYQDFSYRNSNQAPTHPSTPTGLNLALNQPIPLLPLTLGGLSVWTAIMSVLLLTVSELIVPIYVGRGLLLNRRHLRIAGLTLVTVFILVTAYQLIIVSSQSLPPK